MAITGANASPVDIQRYLKHMKYPATKTQIIAKAKDNGADDEVVTVLDAIDDKTYKSPAHVNRALGMT